MSCCFSSVFGGWRYCPDSGTELAYTPHAMFIVLRSPSGFPVGKWWADTVFPTIQE